MLGAALQTSMRADGAGIVQLVRREPEQLGELRWEPSGKGGFAASEALEGLEAAIHLSGANVAAHRWTPEYRREIAASRVDSTRALATALAGLRNPPPVLLV